MSTHEYQRGYLDGYRTVRSGHDLGLDEADRIDAAEGMGQPVPPIPDQGEYWIGYHHGRSHATTGQAPTGAGDRIPSGL